MPNRFQHLTKLLEPLLLEEIEEVGVYMEYAAAETIIKYGQNIRMMPIILEGSIKVSRMNADDSEVFLYYVSSNESCAMTFTCCMQNKVSEIKAVCETNVKLIVIPISYMDKWMNLYPSWKSFVMHTIQARFDELLQTIDQIAFQKLDDRLIDYLNNKARINQKNRIYISHKEIANDLATSRVVVSRLLKKLEYIKKVILYRNEIELL